MASAPFASRMLLPTRQQAHHQGTELALTNFIVPESDGHMPQLWQGSLDP